MDPNDTAETPPEEHLAGLGETFLAAMAARQRADVDTAQDLLREIIRKEPRLPEPHLELGRIHLDAGRLHDAEAETREALRLLALGGQWVDDVPEAVMGSIAHGQLAEVLRQRADSDEVIFGDPAVFKALLAEARTEFEQARTLDPSNSHADYHAFFIGLGDDVDVEL
ncbi:MAG: hypothetical protein H6739_04965 [Alphaproteobacteria bacterium]|nr:hypothetical protein [Alphaproteobacteria bacterium]